MLKPKRETYYRQAPTFTDQSTETNLSNRIKVVDLLAPWSKGGKIGLFGRLELENGNNYGINK